MAVLLSPHRRAAERGDTSEHSHRQQEQFRLITPNLKRAACALAALSLASCDDVLGEDNPSVTLSFTSQSAAAAGMLLRFDVDGRHAELPATIDSETRITATRFGPIQVRVDLVTSTGDTVASASFDHQLAHHSTHWVLGQLGQQRPSGFCMGTVLAVPLSVTPVGQPAPDTLFVTYGGLPNDVVC
jgi:hypothetical protein